MKFVNLFFRKETFVPMAALTFASASCVMLVLARMVWAERLRYAFLIMNLFLAWMPLVFTMIARDSIRDGNKPGWRFAGWSAAWLLFFPNAPYIFTDLVHLKTSYLGHFWVDLTLILLCAFTALIVGFVSLYLMQSVVTRMRGRVAGWLFVFGVAGLSGFGIYLGRFLRFNSWDVVARPADLYHGITNWAAHSLARPTAFAFPVLFAIFLFVAYVMIYAMAHLPRMNPLDSISPARKLEPLNHPA